MQIDAIKAVILSVAMSLFYGATFGRIFSTVPNAKKTQGVIIERKKCDRLGHGDMFTGVVEYEVDEKKYFKSFPYASKGFFEGTKVNVIYDATNPERVVMREKSVYKKMLAIMIIGIGVAVSIQW